MHPLNPGRKSEETFLFQTNVETSKNLTQLPKQWEINTIYGMRGDSETLCDIKQ